MTNKRTVKLDLDGLELVAIREAALGDGIVPVPAHAVSQLIAIAKAAAVFADGQGGLARGDFAADLFDDLARALEAAGR